MKIQIGRRSFGVNLRLILGLALVGTVLTVSTALLTVSADKYDQYGGPLPRMTHGYPLPWLATVIACTPPPEVYCFGPYYEPNWSLFSLDILFYLVVGYVSVEGYLILERLTLLPKQPARLKDPASQESH